MVVLFEGTAKISASIEPEEELVCLTQILIRLPVEALVELTQREVQFGSEEEEEEFPEVP